MPQKYKYYAFISYSHKDKKWADWLHRSLEGYRVPKKLVGKETPAGPVPKRLFPVFRDREELPVSADLSQNITEALKQSKFLIVICSPNSAKSKWVNEEILAYKRLGGEGRILCLIVDGEPNAGDKPELQALECFPEALRFKVGFDGSLTTERTEPIAADVRKGMDGKGNSKLKIAAGMLGVGFDELRERDKEQQARKKRKIIGTLTLLAVIFVTSFSGFCVFRELMGVTIVLSELKRMSEDQLYSSYVLDNFSFTQGYYLASIITQGTLTRTLQAETCESILQQTDINNNLFFNTLTLSKNGSVVLGIGQDSVLRLFDTRTGKCKTLIKQIPGVGVKCWLSLDQNKAGVLLSHIDYTHHNIVSEIRHYNISAGKECQDALIVDGPTGRYCSSGNLNKLIFVSVPAKQMIGMLLKQSNILNLVRFETDGKESSENIVVGSVSSIKLSPDEKTFAVTALNGKTEILDVVTGSRILKAIKCKGIGLNSAFSPDGKYIVVTSGIINKSLTRVVMPYWSLKTEDQLMDVTGPKEGYAQIFDGRTGKKISKPLRHTGWVTKVVYNADGSKFITGASDGTARIWNAQNGLPLTAEMRSSGWVTAVGFTNDGRKALSASSDGLVMLWDATTGEPVSDTVAYKEPIITAFFGPDDREVFVMTAGRLVSIINAETGEVVMRRRWADPRIWYHRGMEHYFRAMYSEAQSDFTKALECDPNHMDAKKYKALAEEKTAVNQ